MLRRLTRIAAVALASILLRPAASQADPPAHEAAPSASVAFVNLRRVFEECPQGREIAARVAEESSSYDAEINRLQKEVDRLAPLAASLPAGQPEAEKYRLECERLRASVSRTTTARKVAMEGLESRLRLPCYREVQEVVTAVATRRGVTAVFNRTSPLSPDQGIDIWRFEMESQPVVYCDPALDLTEAVLAELNLRARGTGTASTGKAGPAAPPAIAPASSGAPVAGGPRTAAPAEPRRPGADALGGRDDGSSSPQAAESRDRLKAELKAEILAELKAAGAPPQTAADAAPRPTARPAGEQGPIPAAAAPAPGQPDAALGFLEGRILLRGTGVAGCQVKAILLLPQSSFLGGTEWRPGDEFVAKTDPQGSYRFGPIPAGKYRIKWLAPGGDAWIRRVREEPDAEVLADKTTRASDIDLGRRVLGE